MGLWSKGIHRVSNGDTRLEDNILLMDLDDLNTDWENISKKIDVIKQEMLNACSIQKDFWNMIKEMNEYFCKYKH